MPMKISLSNACLIIDDHHRVSTKDQKKIQMPMKISLSNACLIIDDHHRVSTKDQKKIQQIKNGLLLSDIVIHNQLLSLCISKTNFSSRILLR
ncbi:hypothetical protein MKW98_010458, partial [Papaver atlanticum]